MPKTRSSKVFQEIHETNLVFDIREQMEPSELNQQDRRALAKKRRQKKVKH